MENVGSLMTRKGVSFLLSVPCKFELCAFCLGVMWKGSLSHLTSLFLFLSPFLYHRETSYFLYLQCRTYAKVPIHMEWEKKKSHQVGISLLWHTHTHTHTHFQVCSSMLVLQIMPALLWHNRHNCAKKIIKHNNSIKNNLYEIVPFAELKGHYLISIGRIERPLFHNPLMLYLYFTVFVNLTGAYVRNIFNL